MTDDTAPATMDGVDSYEECDCNKRGKARRDHGVSREVR